MPQDQAYRETADQQPLTHFIEVELVRNRSRSFRRIWHAIEELVHAVDYDVVVVTPHLNQPQSSAQKPSRTISGLPHKTAAGYPLCQEGSQLTHYSQRTDEPAVKGEAAS